MEGAAFEDSPFGVTDIDGVTPMVNKDIVGEVCYNRAVLAPERSLADQIC